MVFILRILDLLSGIIAFLIVVVIAGLIVAVAVRHLRSYLFGMGEM